MSTMQASRKPKNHNHNARIFKRECEEYQPCTTRKMTEDELKRYEPKSKEARNDGR